MRKVITEKREIKNDFNFKKVLHEVLPKAGSLFMYLKDVL